MELATKSDVAEGFNSNQENNFDSERRLWTAVLLQAVEDWRSNNMRARNAADTFLFRSGTDFETVCHGAGFDPSALQSKLQRLRCRLPLAPQAEFHVPA